MVKPTQKSSLEKDLAQLEQLLDTMENKDLSLEESIKTFELGVCLVEKCQKTLQQAEQKIKILMKKNKKLTMEDYSEKDEHHDG